MTRADGFGASPSLRVSVYVDHPSLIKPASIEDPSAALAELIDAAIALINGEIAAQDRFISEAREVRSIE